MSTPVSLRFDSRWVRMHQRKQKKWNKRGQFGHLSLFGSFEIKQVSCSPKDNLCKTKHDYHERKLLYSTRMLQSRLVCVAVCRCKFQNSLAQFPVLEQLFLLTYFCEEQEKSISRPQQPLHSCNIFFTGNHLTQTCQILSARKRSPL